jgi:hypothetical protein
MRRAANRKSRARGTKTCLNGWVNIGPVTVCLSVDDLMPKFLDYSWQ